MLSILQEIQTAEQFKSLALGWSGCYLSCLADMQRHAIQFEADLTAGYQRELEQFAATVKAGPSPRSLSEAPPALRAILDDHQRRAQAYLGQLRKQFSDTASALQDLLTAMTADQTRHDLTLKETLSRLKKSVDLPDPQQIRVSVLALTSVLTECVEQIQRRHALAIAQLTDEITLLHRQVDDLKISGVGSSEIRRVIDDAMSAGIPFSVVFIRLRNLNDIQASQGTAVAAAAVRCGLQRLSSLEVVEANMGHWQKDVLAVLLPPSRPALDFTRTAMAALSGKYDIVVNGSVQVVNLQIATATLQRPASETADKTRERIAALLNTMGTTA